MRFTLYLWTTLSDIKSAICVYWYTENIDLQIAMFCSARQNSFSFTIKFFAVTESQWKGSLSFQLLDLKLDFCKLAKNTCTYETVKLILVNYLFYWECHHFDIFPDFKTWMHWQNYYGAVIMIFVLLSQDFCQLKYNLCRKHLAEIRLIVNIVTST